MSNKRQKTYQSGDFYKHFAKTMKNDIAVSRKNGDCDLPVHLEDEIIYESYIEMTSSKEWKDLIAKVVEKVVDEHDQCI